LSETPSIINSVFLSILFFIIGFFAGEKQVKKIVTNVSHNFSERMLQALQILERGEIPDTLYNRMTESFEVQRPEATTASL